MTDTTNNNRDDKNSLIQKSLRSQLDDMLDDERSADIDDNGQLRYLDYVEAHHDTSTSSRRGEEEGNGISDYVSNKEVREASTSHTPDNDDEQSQLEELMGIGSAKDEATPRQRSNLDEAGSNPVTSQEEVVVSTQEVRPPQQEVSILTEADDKVISGAFVQEGLVSDADAGDPTPATSTDEDDNSGVSEELRELLGEDKEVWDGDEVWSDDDDHTDEEDDTSASEDDNSSSTPAIFTKFKRLFTSGESDDNEQEEDLSSDNKQEEDLSSDNKQEEDLSSDNKQEEDLSFGNKQEENLSFGNKQEEDLSFGNVDDGDDRNDSADQDSHNDGDALQKPAIVDNEITPVGVGEKPEITGSSLDISHAGDVDSEGAAAAHPDAWQSTPHYHSVKDSIEESYKIITVHDNKWGEDISELLSVDTVGAYVIDCTEDGSADAFIPDNVRRERVSLGPSIDDENIGLYDILPMIANNPFASRGEPYIVLVSGADVLARKISRKFEVGSVGWNVIRDRFTHTVRTTKSAAVLVLAYDASGDDTDLRHFFE